LGSPKVGDHWEDLGIGGRMDNIKMDLMEIGTDGENWIPLAQDRVQWQAFLSTVMNHQVP
jgi:hypothetical protein